MVQRGQAAANELVELTEAALASGTLDIEALFDRDYREVPGSNPALYRTRLSDWADRNWRAQLDNLTVSDPAIMAAACTDMNGFLPTHLTRYSQAPTGDVAHDTAYCRNGRKILDSIRSEEHTSELQSRENLVCRLLLEKKKRE